MKKKLFQILSLFLALTMIGGILPINAFAEETESKFAYLEDLEVIASDRYTGNQGDSFIGKIGLHNGTTDIYGNEMSHGLEAWLARWNFKQESSWAWVEYALNGEYAVLSGKITIIENCANKSNFDSTIEIYGDGNIIYSARLTPEMEIITVNISVLLHLPWLLSFERRWHR